MLFDKKIEISTASGVAGKIGLLSADIGLDKKVNSLIFELNSINVSQDITNTYNSLRLNKTEIISAYELISNMLKEELTVLVEVIYQLKLKIIQTEKSLESLSSEIRDLASSIDPNTSLESCQQYKNFLSMYETCLDFSKEIVVKKGRVEVIIQTQKILDTAYASKMVEIDYQLIKLDDIINNFHKVRSESILKVHSKEFDYCNQFKSLILEKDYEFDQIKEKLKSSSNGTSLNISSFKEGVKNIDSLFNQIVKVI